MTDPLGDWEAAWRREQPDETLTAVQRRYLDVLDEWLRADDNDRPKHEDRRQNLVDLMRHDNPKG